MTPEQAALAVQLGVDNASPNVGDTVTFTLTVTNSGPDEADGLVILNALPTGLTVTGSTAGQGTFSAQTGLWSVGTLADGQTSTLTFTATVGTATPLTDSASVHAVDEYDPDTSDASASTLITPQIADLALTAAADSAEPNVGDEVTLTVTVNDEGPDAATDVSINAALPAGLTFVSAEPSVGTYDSLSGVWSVGTVGTSSPEVLQIVATVDSPVAATFSTSIAHSDQADTIPANEEASVTETPQESNLEMLTSVDNTRPNVGDDVTFTITLSNSGPDDATGVQLSIPLPSGLTFVSSDPDAGTYDSTTGIWTVGAVSAGTPIELQIVALVSGDGANTVTATLTHSDQYNPATNGVLSGATVTPQQSDLALSSTVSDATPTMGEQETLTFTLSDGGPDAATGVEVSVSLPTGMTYVSSDPSVGTYDATTGIWTVGDVDTDVAGDADARGGGLRRRRRDDHGLDRPFRPV